MRVLAISSYGVLGGAELSLEGFCAHRPEDVHMRALLVEDGPLRARLEALGIPTYTSSGDYDGRPTPSRMVRFSRSLGAVLAQLEPDVVWAIGLKAAVMAAPACRAAKVALVWHKVDFSLDGVIALPLAAAVDGVVSVSEAVAHALGPLRARKLLAVVGLPVRLDPQLHLHPESTPPTIGTLATLVPIKGHRHIVQAGALLAEEFPELRIVLAGAESSDHPGYAHELRELAQELGIAERLELTGFVQDVTDVLTRLTVFVNATYRAERHYGREGLGGSMLEASWAGVPVVATRGGGSPEGLNDGVTGTLVDPADPAAIALAIARYLRDRELARLTGEAGRHFARERFAPAVVAAKLFGALDLAAARKGTRR
jgi:glycosyltransferase involved in cell wall biosynthesis